ncbi:MAG: DUF6056 family protein [Clostridia bacterium]
MTKLINYIKSNKLFISIMILGIIAFSIQTSFVVMYADDLGLGAVANENGFQSAIKQLQYDYQNWGGGPTSMIAVMCLTLGINFWKILSIVIVTAIVLMITSIIAYKSKVNKGLIAGLIWICIYLVDIYISRETLYWLDGSLAYVLTSFNILLFFYYMYRRIIMKLPAKKYDFILLPILAFFAGWSGPQSGVIILAMITLLFIWSRFIEKNKIEKKYFVYFAIAIIGFLIYYLSPGNKLRFIGGFPELANLNTIDLIFYRMQSVFDFLFTDKFQFGATAFYITILFSILIGISINLISKEVNISKLIKVVIYICNFILISFIVVTMAIKLNIIGAESIKNMLFGFHNILNELLNNTFNIKMLIPYIFCFGSILSSIILSLYISLKFKNIILFLSVSCAFLSQAIMLVAPYSPNRTAFIGLMLFWIAITYGIKIMMENKFNFSIVFIPLLLNFGIKFVLLYILVLLIFCNIKNMNKIANIVGIIAILYLTLFNYYSITKGYYLNKKIYCENVNRINKAKVENKKELSLLKPVDEKYGFTKMIGSPWIEEALKAYYKLDENIILIEE